MLVGHVHSQADMTNVARLVDILRSREKTDGAGVCIHSEHEHNFDISIMSYESSEI